MAKKLVKDVLPRNLVISVCKSAKTLMEEVCTAEGLDDWVFALHDGWQKYCLNHSEVQKVIFTAAIAIHRIIVKENGIVINFYPMPIMTRKVENFSCHKKVFKVRVEDEREQNCEFNTLIFTLD